jgi:hypothetical protein
LPLPGYLPQRERLYEAIDRVRRLRYAGAGGWTLGEMPEHG